MAIYNGKHCVFEQVGVESSSFQWNLANNVDSDNCYNDYNISRMRDTTLPARLLLLSSVLQENLTNTTIQTATNGKNGTLVSTSDKLFLVAEKEITATRQFSRTEEFSALTTWSYYTTHTQANDRIKKDQTNTARSYWLRSPASTDTGGVILVVNTGSFNYFNANSTGRVSLCYAF